MTDDSKKILFAAEALYNFERQEHFLVWADASANTRQRFIVRATVTIRAYQDAIG